MQEVQLVAYLQKMHHLAWSFYSWYCYWKNIEDNFWSGLELSFEMVGLDAYLEAVNQVEAPLHELYDKLRWRPLYMSSMISSGGGPSTWAVNQVSRQVIGHFQCSIGTSESPADSGLSDHRRAGFTFCCSQIGPCMSILEGPYPRWSILSQNFA